MTWNIASVIEITALRAGSPQPVNERHGDFSPSAITSIDAGRVRPQVLETGFSSGA
jgi:hypothetical protein